MTAITWRCDRLSDLSAVEVFRVLQLRAEVFVVEQQEIYLDPDEHDLQAWHVRGYHHQQLVAYGRIFRRDNHLVIGRIIIEASYRGQGLAGQLMTFILAWVEQSPHAHLTLKLSAQTHLQAFYQKFGFQPCSEVYVWGSIAHIDMQRAALA